MNRIRQSTPRPCCSCDLRRPTWHRIDGVVLPGERSKCIRIGGTCDKVKGKQLPVAPNETMRRRSDG